MTSYPGEDPQRPQDDRPQDDRPEPTVPYGQRPASPLPGPGQSGSYGPPPGYGPPPAYGPPGAWQGYPPYAVQPPAHPQSTLAMALGLVGLIGAMMFCGLPLLVSPFAWAIGHNALREIRESHGALGGESEARVGMVTGIVGTVVLGLGVLALLAFGAVMLVGASTY